MVEHEIEDDLQDVVMNLFSLSLEEDSRIWCKHISDSSITNLEQFREEILEQWEVIRTTDFW